jgi:hypothetical protein
MDPRWSLAATGLWALAGVARGIQLVTSAVRLRGIGRRATPVLAAETLGDLGWRRSPVLCTSVDVDRPCVIGFLRPRILVPEALFAELSAPDIEQVVLHEMEHLRRGDDWTNLLQKLALTIFPLNPVLAWVERRLCLERELACDDGVLRSTGAPKAYATCLARLAEHAMMLRDASSLALGALGAALEQRSELVRRVHRILALSQSGAMGRRQTAAVTTVLVAGLFGGAAALEHAPRLVSFAPAAIASSASLATGDSGLPEVSGGPHMRLAVAHGEARPQLISAVMPGRTGAVRPSLDPPSLDRPDVERLASPRQHASAATSRAVRAVDVKAPRRSPLGVPMQRASLQQAAQQHGPWVVLTGWQSVPAPAMLLSLPDESRYSYAAVRVPDGWLIVSL